MSGRQGRGGWRGAKTTRTTGCLLSVTTTIHHRGHDPRISHATLFLLAFIPLAAPTLCSEVMGRRHWNRRPSPPARYLSRLPLPRAPLARFGPLQLKPAMSGLLHGIPIHTTAQDGVVQSDDIEPAWMGKKKIFRLPLPPLPRCSNSRCYLPAVGQSRFRLCNAPPHSSSHDLTIEAKELCLDGNGRRWGQGRSTGRYTEAASEGRDGCPCIWQRRGKAGRKQ